MLKLKTRKGWLTSYAYACGYHEKTTAPPFVITLEYWRSQDEEGNPTKWLVKVVDERMPWREVVVVRAGSLKHARWGFTRLKRDYTIESALIAMGLERDSPTFRGAGTIIEDGFAPSSA